MVFFIWLRGFGNLRIEVGHLRSSGKTKLEGYDVFLEVGLGTWFLKIEELNLFC
jgi:hypothetical protein